MFNVQITAQMFIKMQTCISEVVCTYSHVGLKIYGVMRHLFFNFDEVATVLALLTVAQNTLVRVPLTFSGEFLN